MSNHYDINGKYWNTIDKIIEKYMLTDEFKNGSNKSIDKIVAAHYLENRLNNTASNDSILGTCFTITENEKYGLIKIVDDLRNEFENYLNELNEFENYLEELTPNK